RQGRLQRCDLLLQEALCRPPMIECSSCLTWIHLSCAKIKRTHIPDTWNCSKCSDKPLSNNTHHLPPPQHL
ncbi:Uncharacterized protein FKW44_017039, partial [Caligus rogercresseyi]